MPAETPAIIGVVESPVGFWGVVASLVLVVLAVGLSIWRGLGLSATITWAATRAAVQLFAVGLVLAPLLATDAPLGLSFVWIAAMVVVAAETVRFRAPNVPGLRWVALAAIGFSSVTGLAVVFGLQILPLEPIALIPIAGILIGNTLPSTVLGVSRTVAELDGNRAEIEGMLALGFPSSEAKRRPIRAAARTALIPQIERTKVVGLVALPGAMTGLLLAGVDPVDAVALQLVVMYLILGAVAVSVLIVVLVVSAGAFTSDGRYEPFAAPQSGAVSARGTTAG